MCDFCPNACHFGCVGLDVRACAQSGDWQCPVCRKADDLTRLDEKPRGRGRPKGTGQPTSANTVVTRARSLPAVTGQLRRPVGRPRKVVAFEAVDSDLVVHIPDTVASGPRPLPSTSGMSLQPQPPRQRTTRTALAASFGPTRAPEPAILAPVTLQPPLPVTPAPPVEPSEAPGRTARPQNPIREPRPSYCSLEPKPDRRRPNPIPDPQPDPRPGRRRPDPRPEPRNEPRRERGTTEQTEARREETTSSEQ
jgi:hypothetical protein